MASASRALADIYPLSPMQRGILFHTLHRPRSGMYVVQLCAEIEGYLDAAAFRGAWEHVVQRHAALRTSFAWQDSSEPVQIVESRASIPIEEQNWSGASAAEQAAGLKAYLATDRERGFDIERAPLLRLLIAHCGRERTLLVWTRHHLVLDGWSGALVLNEVLQMYAGIQQGRAVTLPPFAPYVDYIAWLEQQDTIAAQRFWRRYLDGLDRPTRIVPASREEAAAGLALERVQLSGSVQRALSTLTLEFRVTVAAIAHAAWGELLRRYCGHDDVVFGSVVSGRPPELSGVESMIGVFINTLPVRLGAERAETGISLVQRLQREQLNARSYDYLPLARIQASSPFSKDVPLVDHILVCENYPVDQRPSRDLHGVRFSRVWTVEANSYPLTALLTVGSHLELRLLYDRQILSEAAARRMVRHWAALMSGIATNPSHQVARLEMLSRSESIRLLAPRHVPAAPSQEEPLVLGRLVAQVVRQPDAIAVVCGRSQISYGALHSRAKAIARRLRVLGVAPETPVGLCVSRGVDLIAAVLGVLYAGGAYLPLDSMLPRERLQWLIADGHASVIVAERSTECAVSGVGATLVLLDEIASLEPDGEPFSLADSPMQVAYVIHTSGSTGRPKGVVVTHANLSRLFTTTALEFQFNADDVWTMCHAETFDFSVWEFWGALLHGGRLIVLTTEERRDPERVHAVLSRHGVTVLNQTPSAFRHLARVVAARPHSSSVRLVIFGGESLPSGLTASWMAGHPACSFINMYGITETTVHATYHRLTSPVWSHEGSPIGRHLPDLRIYLLDGREEPVPLGGQGELYVGGAGVSRGYLGQPALTAERFVPDPFGTERGQRLYRSGDFGRWQEDGELTFLGRLDAQVKVRGYRVEPGEIQAHLRAHPSVDDAVVRALTNAPDDIKLVAYVLSSPGTALDLKSLRAHLQRHLPAHMIPSSFVGLDAWPLTEHGKIDFSALPPPQHRPGNDQFNPPRNTVEEVLCALWGGTLGLDHVGIDDDFFELGGHSLMVTQIIAQARQLFGVEMSHASVFAAPTVATFAAMLEREKLTSAARTLPPLVRSEEEGLAPLSFAQERLWFLDQLRPGDTTYNITMAFRCDGPLNIAAVEAAVDRLVELHESLRVRFAQQNDGTPFQAVAPQPMNRVAFHDLTHEEDQEGGVAALVQSAVATAYDLELGWLWRFNLLRLTETAHVFVIAMHHIICDEWSLNMLLREFGELYTQHAATGHLPPLSLPPVRYSDYAVWQRGQAHAELFARQLGYWRLRLAGVEGDAIPTDLPRSSREPRSGARAAFDLGPDVSRRLKSACLAERVTPFIFLLAVFQIVLARYAGAKDVIVGSPVAGRIHPSLAGVFGFFVNTVILRGDIGGEPDFRELLRRSRDAVLEAGDNADVPFQQVVDAIMPNRKRGGEPPFHAWLVVHHIDRLASIPIDGVRITSLPTDSTGAPFDLALSVTYGPETLTGYLNYDAGLFTRHTAVAIVSALERLLEQALLDVTLRPSDLELGFKSDVTYINHNREGWR